MTKTKRQRPRQGGLTLRTGRAPAHRALATPAVHVFVDDQNLFYGIRNQQGDKGYRIDFGRLLLEVARDGNGATRGVASAYIAGVIPDDEFVLDHRDEPGVYSAAGLPPDGQPLQAG